jgi:deoxycytidylate deaminase
MCGLRRRQKRRSKIMAERRLDARLDKVERLMGAGRCAACAGRPEHAVVTTGDDDDSDQEKTLYGDTEPCPICGWQPTTIRIEYVRDWR